MQVASCDRGGAVNAPASGKRAMVRGAAWMVGMRWSIRLLGLGNTVVMARLLMPSEYGIVAMATVVVGIVQVMLEFGASTALMRKAQLERDDIDSAWTLRLLQGLAVCGLLVLISPLASRYFSEPRVMGVLWALAVGVVVSSTANIGVVVAQKSYDFALEFRVQIGANIVRVVVTIIAGLAWRDYRALVLGIVVGQVMSSALSYALHPYRPSWNTRKIPEIWGVTKWLLLSGIGLFILRRGDEVIAGRIADSPGEFGLYTVGADLGQMPTAEVGPAMLRALLPILSSMSGPAQQVNEAVIKVAGATNTVTLPLGFGMAALAMPFTALVLGPNWTDAAFFIAGFALVGVLQSMPGSLTTLLVMRGMTKQHSMTVWVEFCAFLAMSAVLVPHLGLLGLVWARASGAAVGVLTAALFARRLCQLNLLALVKRLVRPAMGAWLMFLLLRWFVPLVEGPALQLSLGIFGGALFYVVWCLLSWRITGRPEGLESMAIGWLGRRRARPSTSA